LIGVPAKSMKRMVFRKKLQVKSPYLIRLFILGGLTIFTTG